MFSRETAEPAASFRHFYRLSCCCLSSLRYGIVFFVSNQLETLRKPTLTRSFIDTLPPCPHVVLSLVPD